LLAVVGAVALTLGLGGWALSGASEGPQKEPEQRPVADVAQAEKRLAQLDQDRAQREEALADLERRKAAQEAELTQAAERIAGLEKRRDALRAEIAELVAPIAPPKSVGDADPIRSGGDAASEGTTRSSRLESPPAASPKASIEEDAASPMDAPPDEPEAARPAGGSPARTARTEPDGEIAETGDPDAPGLSADDVATVASVRVFIHVRASDQAAIGRARSVAAELRRKGVDVVQIRGVPYAVRRDAVRFFYDADRSSVPVLQRAVRNASQSAGAAPLAEDYRRYAAPPRPGTMELWLS
jgi:TolA-binding protein